MIYANEIDPKACHWMERLPIQIDKIDSRSIKEVQADDLKEFTQCHFFAGIAGWPLALEMAGWPIGVEVWTGSCPCQPFSAAGKQKGTSDERHLWPEWFRLIKDCRPGIIFGEQVASSTVVGKHSQKYVEFTPEELVWIDAVFNDLEGASYTCAAFDLPAASCGAPHIRQRLFWVAYRSGQRWDKGRSCDGRDDRNIIDAGCERYGVANAPSSSRPQHEREPGKRSRRGAGPENAAVDRCDSCGLGIVGVGNANIQRLQERISDRSIQREKRQTPQRQAIELSSRLGNTLCSRCGQNDNQKPSGDPETGDSSGLGDPTSKGSLPGTFSGLYRSQESPGSWDGESERSSNPWSDVEYIPCRDRKARPVKPRICLLVDGVSARLADGTEIGKKEASRVTMLRGLGNAIVPQLASVFIRSFMESINA